VPELPEVETLRRQLEPLLVTQTVERVHLGTHHRFREGRGARHCQVTAVCRRGKYLIVPLLTPTGTSQELVVHLGMTGQLHWDRRPADHVHLGLGFSSGTLWFRDPRRFGQVRLVVPGEYQGLPILSLLGPEPDDKLFTASRVERFLGVPGPPVKARLLEQRLVAGIGNYIADEALWRAAVHPAAAVVSPAGCRQIHRAVRKVVADSIAHGGVSERDYIHLDGSVGSYQRHLVAYGRAGRPCRRCRTLLVKGRIAGRGTVWCPACQRL
jgi:formamidopyrimidine-DNA glycosylase